MKKRSHRRSPCHHLGPHLLWTAWIVVGTVLEERDLVVEMGPTYRAYRRRVPMLMPWRRPSAVDFS